MNIFLATSSPQNVWTFAVDHLHYGPPRCPCTKGSPACFPYFVPTTSVIVIIIIILKFVMDLELEMPWFNVSFDITYTQDIEVHVCSNKNSLNERVILIELNYMFSKISLCRVIMLNNFTYAFIYNNEETLCELVVPNAVTVA